MKPKTAFETKAGQTFLSVPGGCENFGTDRNICPAVLCAACSIAGFRMKTITMAAAFLVLIAAPLLRAKVTVTVGHNDRDSSTPAFLFKDVPPPSANDAATHAVFTIVDGNRSTAGGDVCVLHDNILPADEDEPSENFFFASGTRRGRLLVDLREPLDIKQVNTYSWHRAVRASQSYTLYAADGAAPDFDPHPKNGKHPEQCGWTRIAQVDTRPIAGEPPPGQYGVSISDSEPAGTLGRYRYLLFEIYPSTKASANGQTFYSEIDVIDARAPVKFLKYTPPAGFREVFKSDDGVYQFTIDTTRAPEMNDWARAKMVPIVKEWYPKLVKMLPSKGYEAPKSITILCKPLKQGGAPAMAGGREITCNSNWFMKNLRGEAGGAVVHEMVHLVQRYGEAKRNNPNATRNPGWLVEGIADYIRWYLYEPRKNGAHIGPNRADKVNYDGSYRTTANFINWVSLKYDKEIAFKLNAACRQGLYTEDLWKKHTGRTVQELNAEWKAHLANQPPK